MAVTDKDRRNLFVKLADQIGEDDANNLMQLLPPQPYTELATRQDVLASASIVRGEMAELRGELRGEMAELRGEMAELRGTFQRWAGAILAANGVALITALVT